MGLLKDIPWLFTEIEKDSKDESDVSPWMRNIEGSDIEKNEKIKSELEIEEEKYLEKIFEGRKNEFNSIFSTINGTNTEESPEEKLKKFIWLNFNVENFYLDDNVSIDKNIAVELYLTDEEIKNGTTKIVKYEKTELISKYNYINETEEMENQTVKYEKEIVIPPNVEEGAVYKFIGFGNCFEDIDEKIQQGDLYVFILRGVKNEYM
ncbi:hypothetical protein [Fusobacterium animalis]|uniref:Uncharacterized protein n=1 Tax=Fusobacterium animalis TaxID=76859 RepID=A0A2B7YXN7_9FUSO|nr:hypothetical protein [Fusobacterium animalis]PGH25357.1 hypothetical protein RN90_08155 [Fusobacterium animalis]